MICWHGPTPTKAEWRAYLDAHPDLDRELDITSRPSYQNIPHIQSVLAKCERAMHEIIGQRGQS